MTPEQRAAKFSWQQCPGGAGHFAGHDGNAYACAQCNADEIRAAEDEARSAADAAVALLKKAEAERDIARAELAMERRAVAECRADLQVARTERDVAEGEAIERAAGVVFDAICAKCDHELNMERLRDRIRSLKSTGGER